MVISHLASRELFTNKHAVALCVYVEQVIYGMASISDNFCGGVRLADGKVTSCHVMIDPRQG